MEQNSSQQQPKGRELTAEEEKEMKMGFDLDEMVKSSVGWRIVARWLKDRMYHTWIDPRGMKKEAWEWAELNAFHSHDVAKEILLNIKEAIDRAHHLHKVKTGQTQEKSMRI